MKNCGWNISLSPPMDQSSVLETNLDVCTLQRSGLQILVVLELGSAHMNTCAANVLRGAGCTCPLACPSLGPRLGTRKTTGCFPVAQLGMWYCLRLDVMFTVAMKGFENTGGHELLATPALDSTDDNNLVANSVEHYNR
eukprot:4223950-Amphidinium_carterae.2